MSNNELLMKEVNFNLVQISDYLESVGPNIVVDHLSSIALNIRYAELVKLLIEYTSTLEPLLLNGN